MVNVESHPNRRLALMLLAAASLSPIASGQAAEDSSITIHKDPNCGCCSGWALHLQKNGFATKIIETSQTDAVKKRLGVPGDLASCHTAEVGGYVVEGHVPATALKRLLAEKPVATGLAVAGMPMGSPGMEGGQPERYDVVLFGLSERRVYMRFIGERQI